MLDDTTLSFAATLKDEAANVSGGLKAIASNRSDLFHLNPYLIQVQDGWNSRDMRDPENREHIDQLARSIAAIGVQEPLTVYMQDGRPTLTDGHCRLQAAIRAIEEMGAEIRAIPVKVEPRGSDEKDRILSQVLRNSGKRLSPLEQGSVYKRLLDLGWTESEIARRVGVQPIQVSRYLDLRAAPAPVQDMVASGEVSATLALQTMQDQGETKATEVLTEAVKVAKERGKTKATLSTVTEVVTGAKVERKRKGATKAEAQAAPIADALIQALNDLLLHMPEYDEEENPAFSRAHKNAIGVLAIAEEQMGK